MTEVVGITEILEMLNSGLKEITSLLFWILIVLGLILIFKR